MLQLPFRIPGLVWPAKTPCIGAEHNRHHRRSLERRTGAVSGDVASEFGSPLRTERSRCQAHSPLTLVDGQRCSDGADRHLMAPKATLRVSDGAGLTSPGASYPGNDIGIVRRDPRYIGNQLRGSLKRMIRHCRHISRASYYGPIHLLCA